jgi:adenosylmethionine-8-amino-7-oxononanoate aminotransferase
MIAGFAPGDLDEVFFVSSGSEAVESAIKLARSYHLSRGDEARYKVISREWSYHGTTLGGLALTGVPKIRNHYLPMLWDGARHAPNTLGDSADVLASAAAVEAMIVAEGPETVSAVIAEPVQNGRGGLVPPDGYWQELRQICDRHGVLLIADEVICAFGRFGHWFASERFGAEPDLVTFAKGVTSAYLPLGGVVARRPVVDSIWDSPMAAYMHGSTFGGHPASTAVAVANMTAMRDEGIMGHVLDHEAGFRRRMDDLAAAHTCVKEVRGLGYFYALELMVDRSTGQELSAEQRLVLEGGELAHYVRDARLLIRPDDRGATLLVVSPPLVADDAVLDDLAAKLGQVLDMTERWIADNS